MKTKLLVNKTMNQEVYKLRRKVIELIYEAKTLVDLPRVDVRITESHERTLGVARVGDRKIWISEKAISLGKDELRSIVYHEILHAVFSVRHIAGCPLMDPIHRPISEGLCKRTFVELARKAAC